MSKNKNQYFKARQVSYDTEEKIQESPEEKIQESPEEIMSKEKAMLKVVKCTSLNIRKLPNRASDVIGVVKVGTILEMRFYQRGWTEVYHAESGIHGFVDNEFVQQVT